MSQESSSRFKLIWNMLTDVGSEWLDDKVSTLGAALAFYSLLSLGPLFVIIIAIMSLVFGQKAASGDIFLHIRSLVGDDGAAAIQNIIANSRNKTDSFFATLVGIVTLLFTATGVFAQLQDALNIIWKVKVEPNRGIWEILRTRFLSFSLLLAIGFLMLISLVISSALAAFSQYFADILPPLILQLLSFTVSFSIITVLFAMIFKILPDVHIRWNDVWIGSAITTILFFIGKQFMGMYISHSQLNTTYGAAGSLIVVLVWIYYSTQILFLGAEFTQIYARYFGKQGMPARGAIPLQR